MDQAYFLSRCSANVIYDDQANMSESCDDFSHCDCLGTALHQDMLSNPHAHFKIRQQVSSHTSTNTQSAYWLHAEPAVDVFNWFGLDDHTQFLRFNTRPVYVNDGSQNIPHLSYVPKKPKSWG
jgi:hypothetical protein